MVFGKTWSVGCRSIVELYRPQLGQFVTLWQLQCNHAGADRDAKASVKSLHANRLNSRNEPETFVSHSFPYV